MDFYNEVAGFYDKWVSNDSEATRITEFYSDYISTTNPETNIIYLAIGTGRIALEIAKSNPNLIIGIDQSQSMLDVCKNIFFNSKKEEQLTLFKQDILSLDIRTKNNFYILPFRTISHFISKEDKKICLKSIYDTMQVGEIFIFDTDIFDVKKAQKINNKYLLGFHDQGNNEVIYNKFCYDFEKQYADVTVYIGVLNNNKLQNLKTYTYQTSWISTNDLKSIIMNIGFKIKKTIFSESHQIWILQK